MDNAVHVTIGARLATASNIDQKLVYCGNEEGKLVAIRTLLQTSCRPPVLVFVQSKERAQELYCPTVSCCTFLAAPLSPATRAHMNDELFQISGTVV
jgi:superfamily II DNA/RNA helicase